jgi:methionyl-tRNA formyltransferase
VARIVLFGQAQFGERVFEGLREAGHEILAVCPPPDADGRPLDPLKEAATAAGIRVVQRKSYRPPEAYEEVGADRADLAVLAYVTQIIPVEILDAPRLASICFHPSLLPKYRGGSAINWQLIRGESMGGITIFRPDDGIDAGPIYSKHEIEIGPDDTAGSFYYARVFEPGVAAMLEGVDGVLNGTLEGVPQDESEATDDPLCRDEHAGIDWSADTQTIHNLIRGCDPSPGAFVEFGGAKLRLYGSRIGGGNRGAEPGVVLNVTDDGVEIATADGSVRVSKMRAADGKKAASEVAAEVRIAAGARL